MGSSVSSDEGRKILTDAAGNVYLGGFFTGTVDFDPGSGTYNLTSTNSTTDVYISKLNASGNFLWARQMGGSANDAVSSTAVDPSGNIISTGYFGGTVDFNPGSATYYLTSEGDSDIFKQES